jgi:uncharacterized protein involved in exopolysaccharide biosynthesis
LVRPSPPATAESRSSLVSIFASVAERWKLVLAAALLSAAVTAAVVVLLVPRRYEASMTLAAVTAQRLPAGVAGLAGLSGLMADQGFQATPDLLAQILESRRVLLEVAEAPIAPGSPVRVIDRVAAGEPTERLIDVERRMRRTVTVGVDRRTSLIRLSVRHPDSATARRVSTQLVEVAGRTFATLAKSQAAAKRIGQETRAERLEATLRQAELRLVGFLAATRALPPFSPLHAERQRLERDISIAQQAYTQAVAEREAALARELEQTPVLVAVDPLPSELAPLPRFAAFYAALVAIVVLFLLTSVLAAREVVRAQSERGDARSARLLAAIGGIPLLRSLVGVRRAPRER